MKVDTDVKSGAVPAGCGCGSNGGPGGMDRTHTRQTLKGGLPGT